MRGQMWWVDRWRKSTAYTDMTLAEQGAYRNLLDECWLRGGTIPDDDRILARISGDALEWPNVREAVLARFKKCEGGLRNETADEVMSQHKSFKDKQSRAGKARAARASRDSGRFSSPATPPAETPASDQPESQPDDQPPYPYPYTVQRIQRTDNNQSAKPDDGFTPAIEAVFAYWHQATKRTKATKLDPRRRRMLRARLKEEDGPLDARVAALKLAVDGALHDPFYAGENERGKRYWELPNIFRNRDRVEELQAAGRRVVAEQEARQDEVPTLGTAETGALELWNQAKEALKAEVPAQNWNTWFRPTFGYRWDERVLTVAVPSQQHRDQLREVYQERIKAAVGEETLVSLKVGRIA